jgi:geranylgeranylglycerol-phosphate geranylgeranyltransferase
MNPYLRRAEISESSTREKRSFSAVIELIRPSVCGLSALGIAIGGIVSGAIGLTLQFALAIAAAFIVCASGDVINDWFDWRADKVNAPKKPIPSGRVSRKVAFCFYALLSIVGLAAGFAVSLPFFAIAVFNWAVSSAYSWKLKPIPFVKNISVAWLGASTFLAAGLIYGTAPIIGIVLLFVIAFLATLSREILKDIEDVKGDKSAGLKTLPIIFGVKLPKMSAYVLLLADCALLLAPFYLKIFSLYYFIGAVPAVLLCIYSFRQNAHGARVSIKIAMYLAFLGFILGSVL